MKIRPIPAVLIAVVLMTMAIGCDEDEKKAMLEMAQDHLERQEEQNRRIEEMQAEVAAGSRRLVEADAAAREQIVTLQGEIQNQRAEVDHQRDTLETERRAIASQRRLDPIIANTITGVGLLFASLLPLIVCWYLLRSPPETASEQEVAELLLQDVVSNRPVFVLRPASRKGIESRASDPSPLIMDGATNDEEEQV